MAGKRKKSVPEEGVDSSDDHTTQAESSAPPAKEVRTRVRKSVPGLKPAKKKWDLVFMKSIARARNPPHVLLVDQNTFQSATLLAGYLNMSRCASLRKIIQDEIQPITNAYITAKKAGFRITGYATTSLMSVNLFKVLSPQGKQDRDELDQLMIKVGGHLISQNAVDIDDEVILPPKDARQPLFAYQYLIITLYAILKKWTVVMEDVEDEDDRGRFGFALDGWNRALMTLRFVLGVWRNGSMVLKGPATQVTYLDPQELPGKLESFVSTCPVASAVATRLVQGRDTVEEGDEGDEEAEEETIGDTVRTRSSTSQPQRTSPPNQGRDASERPPTTQSPEPVVPPSIPSPLPSLEIYITVTFQNLAPGDRGIF